MFVYTNLKSDLSTEADCGYQFEVLNELKDLSSRADSNCLYHTRFLFESDTLSLKEQAELAAKFQPYACRATYSGSKSIHIIFEFDKEHEAYCAEHYKEIWHSMNNHLFGGKADAACANPARLTRRPNAIRTFTDNRPSRIQKLLFENDNKIHLNKIIFQDVASYMYIPDIEQTYSNGNGKCRHYDVIEHYLNTAYTKITGNGDSDSSLFRAVLCCKKYDDVQTLNEVLNKARRERWSEKELQQKIKNAEKLLRR